MIILKFVVLFGCISIFSALQTYYSEICSNNTLFKNRVPGPSAACQSYDRSALLSNQEIKDVIEKINKNRNLVAIGHYQNLPQAANMMKIHWSPELASFAQSWADQCDPSLHLDRENVCQDTKYYKLSQIVASATDPSSDIKATSFVEIWSNQITDFSGNVSYYNKFRDKNTDCFTQLIWAETEFVGCGKVKFYVNQTNSNIERLVCNFSPSGNVHMKPVYTIGVAGTQCAYNMISDDKFKGLCDYPALDTVRKITIQDRPPSNVSTNCNISNDSSQYEINPIYNYTNTKSKKYIKRRHVLANNSYVAVRYTPLRKLSNKKNLRNLSKNLDDEYLQNQERGHSRLYHGHEVLSLPTNYFQGNNQNFRIHDYTTPPMYLISSPAYRRHPESQECTRKLGHKCNDHCNVYECTRRTPCCHKFTACHSETFTNPILGLSNNVCSCTRQCPTTSTPCCPPILTTAAHNCNCAGDQSHFNIPDMVRSGNHKTTLEFISPQDYSEQLYDTESSKIYKSLQVRKEIGQSRKELKDAHLHPKHNIPDRDYIYASIDSSFRNKRQVKDDISKPFWKMNEMNLKNAPELKSMQYTTLSNRNNRNRRRKMPSVTQFITTESITIRTEDDPNNASGQKQTTEKYLSFNELMYLRKFSENYMDQYNPRRAGENNPTNTATAATTTTEYTTNTPFQRKKHCTRKLTCTWTLYTGTGTGENGRPQIETGSRTPPGYVEGCTRTSTCTRDFQDRNKMATPSGVDDGSGSVSEGGEGGGEGTENMDQESGEDGEYCERRSLNVQRRNANYRKVRATRAYPSKPVLLNSNLSNITKIPRMIEKSACNHNLRIKRQESTYLKGNPKVLSYADIYYLVLNKILKTTQGEACGSKQCPCNCKNSDESLNLMWFYSILYFIK